MNTLRSELVQHLYQGSVIPAHPLALREDLSLDEESQRLLTRYYMSSGAGGIAVGVHTTQFEIRKPGIDLLEKVFSLAAEEVDKARLPTPFLKIAGLLGSTQQAIKEAELAIHYGYHLGLLSMGGLTDYTEEELLHRARAIAEIIPLFGFYLQPSVGGRILSYDFWKEFVCIPNVLAIKVAAFNRYQTLDVVRAVCSSGRQEAIALYTGNDDNIVTDLLTPYRFELSGKVIEKRFVGGLLGHWAVWTHHAVSLLNQIKYCITHQYSGIEPLLAKGIEVTDMNAAIFDVTHQFKGCIPGIHEVLRRQGILKGTWCLDPHETLSPGQAKEIDRVIASYRDNLDNDYVLKFLKENKIIL